MSRTSPSALNQLRIRHLKLIETLAELGSVHKAAHALRLSQPAASAMLRDVENAFGVSLFDRTRKGVTLNGQGMIALARLRTILVELGLLTQELQPTQSAPTVRIGTLPLAFFGPLQSFLPEFLSRADCRVQILEGSGNLLRRLQQNQLDCFLGRIPAESIDMFTTSEYFYRSLYEVDASILAGPSHPLVRKRKVSLDDLTQFEWILSVQGSNTRHVLVTAFAAAGLPPPRIRMETSSFVFTFPLLSTGNYLTVAPRDPALHQERLGLLRILPVRLPHMLTPIAFVARKSAMANPNVRLLWEAIRSTIAYSDGRA
jgi:DNA-binding transcriptional LysR family regulator